MQLVQLQSWAWAPVGREEEETRWAHLFSPGCRAEQASSPSDGWVVSESLGCAGLQPLWLESSNVGPAGPLVPPSTQQSDGKPLLESTVSKI